MSTPRSPDGPPGGPGRPWGERRQVPADTVAVADDAGLAALVSAPGGPGPAGPVLLTGGDLRRTLGGGGTIAGSGERTVVPVDLIEIRAAGRRTVGAAHVLVRPPGWWGEIIAVMNAQFMGSWDVAPRAHPGDGRLDLVRARLPVRDLPGAVRRLPLGAHIPHPGIRIRRITHAELAWGRRRWIRVDGRRWLRATGMEVRVLPAAVTVAV